VGNTDNVPDKLLELLEYEINSSDEHTVRFRWEAGSVAIWDNRCTAYKHISSAGYIKGFETSSNGEKRKYLESSLDKIL
jgi:alpha-ketoglutarate-dependent taurine dioxygenase